MKKSFTSIIIYGFSIILYAHAQSASYKDVFGFNNSFHHQLSTDSITKKQRCCNTWCFGTSAIPLLCLDSYNSFLMNSKVKFAGIKIGAEIAEKIRFGIGFYDLNKNIPLAPVYRDNDTLLRTASFKYWNMFYEYVVFEDFYWELAVPVGLGTVIGKVDTVSSASSSQSGAATINEMSVLNIGFDCQYKFIAWLGVGAGLGYRQTFAPEYLREKINAPSYNFKIKIFPVYLFKAIFMRKKLAEEKNAYVKEKEERKKKRLERNEMKKTMQNK